MNTAIQFARSALFSTSFFFHHLRYGRRYSHRKTSYRMHFRPFWKLNENEISNEDIFKREFPRKELMFCVCLLFFRFRFNNNMSIFWINTSLVPVMFHFKFLMCYFSSEPSNSNAVRFIINCIHKAQLTGRRRQRRKTTIIPAADSPNDFSTHFSLCHVHECAVQSSLRNIRLYIMRIYFAPCWIQPVTQKVNSLVNSKSWDGNLRKNETMDFFLNFRVKATQFWIV